MNHEYSFQTLIDNLPAEELDAMVQQLNSSEPEYLQYIAGMTKFRPIFIKRSPPAKQKAWFLKYAHARPEFAPMWVITYGTKVLMDVEEAALKTLRIGLKPDLGYDPGDPPPTQDEIVAFLKEARGGFGLAHARQWGNIFLLLMDPTGKDVVREALDEMEWNLATIQREVTLPTEG